MSKYRGKLSLTYEILKELLHIPKEVNIGEIDIRTGRDNEIITLYLNSDKETEFTIKVLEAAPIKQVGGKNHE